jgi:hypothetical protein
VYPFISLRHESQNLAEVAGRWRSTGAFTFGWTRPRVDSTLCNYIFQGLSHRRYERLFLQAAGGIGVSTSGTEIDSEQDLEFGERSTEAEPLARKAQAIFQIPTFLRDAKGSYNFLENAIEILRRRHWRALP